MADLGGARVGLLEARMEAELARLIRRHGGEPVLAPALREVMRESGEEVGELIDSLGEGSVQIVTFLTGVGSNALFDEARRLGRLEELLEGLQRTINVCRGQKPWLPLKRRGVPISVTVEEPYTTEDVLATLRALAPQGKGVALLHYGERSGAVAEPLREWGARVQELCLYEWRLPEDTRPLENLIGEIMAGDLDAVAFTSQVQIRHLLAIADRTGSRGRLTDALNTLTVVAAVGPTCAGALEAAGVRARVVPRHPKMGPMVLALADHLTDHPVVPRREQALVAHG